MKTVLISGGSDGLGKAIARQLIKSHNVIILSSREEKLRRVAEEIGCSYRVCDIRLYEQIEKTIEEVGEIDCLINNAGIWLEGDLDASDPERIRDVLDTNTLGTIYLTRAVMLRMKQRKAGRIINIVSQAGLNARAGWPVYTASKWAITGFTKAMQQELEPFGIGVTGVYPATINTELFAKSGFPKDVSKALSPEDVAKSIEFMLSFDDAIIFPELGMKRMKV